MNQLVAHFVGSAKVSKKFLQNSEVFKLTESDWKRKVLMKGYFIANITTFWDHLWVIYPTAQVWAKCEVLKTQPTEPWICIEAYGLLWLGFLSMQTNQEFACISFQYFIWQYNARYSVHRNRYRFFPPPFHVVCKMHLVPTPVLEPHWDCHKFVLIGDERINPFCVKDAVADIIF